MRRLVKYTNEDGEKVTFYLGKYWQGEPRVGDWVYLPGDIELIVTRVEWFYKRQEGQHNHEVHIHCIVFKRWCDDG